MQFSTINGIVLHYSDTGDRPEAPTLVFSNSLGTDLRAWDRLAFLLADRFRIVRYDKRGHGLSQATPAPYRIDDHVADVVGLLDHLRLDGVVLCGLSVGGQIAHQADDPICDQTLGHLQLRHDPGPILGRRFLERPEAGSRYSDAARIGFTDKIGHGSIIA